MKTTRLEQKNFKLERPILKDTVKLDLRSSATRNATQFHLVSPAKWVNSIDPQPSFSYILPHLDILSPSCRKAIWPPPNSDQVGNWHRGNSEKFLSCKLKEIFLWQFPSGTWHVTVAILVALFDVTCPDRWDPGRPAPWSTLPRTPQAQ